MTRNSSSLIRRFFEVFDFPLLRGDACHGAWSSATQSSSATRWLKRLFGDADPLGQRLTITSMRGRNKAEDFTITGRGCAGSAHIVDSVQYAAAVRQHGVPHAQVSG